MFFLFSKFFFRALTTFDIRRPFSHFQQSGPAMATRSRSGSGGVLRAVDTNATTTTTARTTTTTTTQPSPSTSTARAAAATAAAVARTTTTTANQQQQEQPRYSPDHARGEMGCKHYRRRCKLIAPCCGEAFWCRHCHNERKVSSFLLLFFHFFFFASALSLSLSHTLQKPTLLST